jgi:hypothetical protein
LCSAPAAVVDPVALPRDRVESLRADLLRMEVVPRWAVGRQLVAIAQVTEAARRQAGGAALEEAPRVDAVKTVLAAFGLPGVLTPRERAGLPRRRVERQLLGRRCSKSSHRY